MMEAVLCVPLIAIVMGLTFFFGWAMRNQQQVIISNRYTVWRAVTANDPVGGGRLDETFFGNQAGSVSVDFCGGPTDTLEDYVVRVGNYGGAPVEALAQSLIIDAPRFPRSHSAEVSATFPSEVGLWDNFTGAIERRYVREGVEWRNREAALERQVRDQFFMPLDTALLSIPSPGDGLGVAFQRLYLRRWNAR